jgi:hypothetical protein
MLLTALRLVHAALWWLFAAARACTCVVLARAALCVTAALLPHLGQQQLAVQGLDVVCCIKHGLVGAFDGHPALLSAHERLLPVRLWCGVQASVFLIGSDAVTAARGGIAAHQ